MPPPIGEALSAGWDAYKQNFGPVFISTFCAMLLGGIPAIGHFLAVPGMYNVALKAVRGQKPEPNDGFVGFKKFGDHVVMGLLQICGIILCIFGVIITQNLFLPGTFYMLDQGLSWEKAKDKCMAEIKPVLFQWIIFHLVINLIAIGAGMLLCIVGIYFTMPIATCAMAYAYEKSLKPAAVSAGEQNPLAV
jgi:hypothetical protein